jgi:hypothetical protein
MNKHDEQKNHPNRWGEVGRETRMKVKSPKHEARADLMVVIALWLPVVSSWARFEI